MIWGPSRLSFSSTPLKRGSGFMASQFAFGQVDPAGLSLALTKCSVCFVHSVARFATFARRFFWLGARVLPLPVGRGMHRRGNTRRASPAFFCSSQCDSRPVHLSSLLSISFARGRFSGSSQKLLPTRRPALRQAENFLKLNHPLKVGLLVQTDRGRSSHTPGALEGMCLSNMLSANVDTFAHSRAATPSIPLIKCEALVWRRRQLTPCSST